MSRLEFHRVRDRNAIRSRHWHERGDAWTGADWATALGGEVGEALNVVKKLRRAECGIIGARDPSRAELVAKLAEELADSFLYLDLLAEFYEIDLAAAIVDKFNAVSVREGFPDRLP